MIWVGIVAALVVATAVVWTVHTIADAGPLDSKLDGVVSEALTTGDPDLLTERGALNDPIEVVSIETDGDFDGHQTPDQAVATLQSVLTHQAHWSFATTESRLSDYRAGRYAACFPVGAIVARSDDRTVISFIGHGGTITKICIADSEDLVH